MLPKNRLGRSMIRKLHVVGGAEHPHGAQQPVAHTLGSRPAWEGLPAPVTELKPRHRTTGEKATSLPSEPESRPEAVEEEPAAKTTAAKTTAKKTTAKKTTVKKTTAKKTTAKKTTAKKTTAKKSTAKKSTAKRSTAKKAAKAEGTEE
jgi:hypothetical protein